MRKRWKKISAIELKKGTLWKLVACIRFWPLMSMAHLCFSGKRKKDKESGVARGIDFQFVSTVINFDFPLDTYSYIHRAGRTARGANKVRFLILPWMLMNFVEMSLNFVILYDTSGLSFILRERAWTVFERRGGGVFERRPERRRRNIPVSTLCALIRARIYVWA